MIPGTELEKAAADVTSNAGKSLIRGLERVFGALTSEWIAKRCARADATTAAIATSSKIDEERALVTAARQIELDEVDHQLALELARRRADRLLRQMVREQANLEQIGTTAIGLIERATDNVSSKEMNEDWLYKFAEYAQQISDIDVQTLWARVLKSAAVQSEPTLSPASLLLLSQIDGRTAEDVVTIADHIGPLGRFVGVRHLESYNRGIGGTTLNTGLKYLEEIGLIVRDQYPERIRFNDLSFLVGPDTYQFTSRGNEIFDTAIASYRKAQWTDEFALDRLKTICAAQIRAGLDVDIFRRGATPEDELHIEPQRTYEPGFKYTSGFKEFDPETLPEGPLKMLLRHFRNTGQVTKGRRRRE